MRSDSNKFKYRFSEILTFLIDAITYFDSNIMGVKEELLGRKEDNAGENGIDLCK